MRDFFSITARCVALAIKESKAAVVIQSCWRGWVGRKHCVWRKRSIIRVQCRVRQWIAIRRLKELKVIEEREREGEDRSSRGRYFIMFCH